MLMKLFDQKRILNNILYICVFAMVVFTLGLTLGCDNTTTTYSGTLYIATTSGGHVVKVPVTIDPSNKTTPVSTGIITTVQISSGTGANNQTHNYHDVRLDSASNRLYYSAIKVDSTGGDTDSDVHLGYVDLSDDSVHDATLDATPEAQAGLVYCGSGLTEDYLIPITMSHPAYIDVIAKPEIIDGAALSSTDTVKRIMVGDFRGDNPDYFFAHGHSSPDGSRLYVSVNETSTDNGGTVEGMLGTFTTYLLDMEDVTAGTVDASSVIATGTVAGLDPSGASIAFRATYTQDGSKILQAGSNRTVVLDAGDLSVLVNDTNIGGTKTGVENHDTMPLGDSSDYAILALRFKNAEGEEQSSGIQLYDIASKTAIGEPVDTCSSCHSSADTAHALCGIDGSLSAQSQTQ